MIVEDGTGVTGANALITVAEFTQFALDRSTDITSYSNEQIEGGIVVSSVDYIDSYFLFKGDSITTTQGMQLPTDQVTINSKIKLACYQAALLSLKGRLFVDPLDLEVSGQVTLERDKLDVLETEKEFKEGGNYVTKFPTSQTDKLLQPYTVSNGLGTVKRW